MWELVICLGITWAGCGSYQDSKFPNEESCYRALKVMQMPGQQIMESKNRHDVVAYCKPYEERKKK